MGISNSGVIHCSEYHDEISFCFTLSCPGHESTLCLAYPCYMCYPPLVTWLSDYCSVTVLVFRQLLFYLIMAMKHMNGDAEETPGHKMWKDRLALALCSNTTGHTGKKHLLLSEFTGIHWRSWNNISSTDNGKLL